jgi:hypothetical protein
MSPLAGYAAGLAVPWLVLLGELALRPHILLAPFALFAVGVVFVAWLGGLRPALVAALLSAVLADAFVIPGPFTSRLWLVRTALFFVATGVASLLVASLRAARSS